MHWFIGGEFQTRLYGLPVEQARQPGRTESFPTETRLKLNALRRRQTRVEAAGGERFSQMFAHYGVTKLSSQQVRGGSEKPARQPARFSHCVFWTRVTQYSGAAAILTG